MSTRSFNLGQDCTIDIQTSDGSKTYSFSTIGGDLMSFEADPVTNLVTIKPITGSASGQGFEKRRLERMGWKGTIMIGRVNSDFDQLEISASDAYHAGQPDITYVIHQTVRDQDGSGTISEFQFTNCSLWMSKGANYRMGEATTLTYEFAGDECKQIQ